MSKNYKTRIPKTVWKNLKYWGPYILDELPDYAFELDEYLYAVYWMIPPLPINTVIEKWADSMFMKLVNNATWTGIHKHYSVFTDLIHFVKDRTKIEAVIDEMNSHKNSKEMNPEGYISKTDEYGNQFRWEDLDKWDKPEEVIDLCETSPTDLNMVLMRDMINKNGEGITLTKLVQIIF